MRCLYRFREIQAVGLGALLLLTAATQGFCLCGQACCGEAQLPQDRMAAPVETEGFGCCVRDQQADSSENTPCCASLSLKTNRKTPICPCFRQTTGVKALLDASRRRPRLLVERYPQTSIVLKPLFPLSCPKLFTLRSDDGRAPSPPLAIRNCSWRC